MPDLRVPPTAIVNQITQLLRDRYHPGFPILKELLQNADDAEARCFVADFYDSLPGSDHATNPLLRAPGALILNDGECSDTDMEGIRTFADSTKSHDSSRAGKFGIGQKAVFHLCDAFVVVANGHPVKPSWRVVNPFVGITNLPGNVTERWEELPPADRRLLADRFETVPWKRCLGIWIPFRNEDLHVAPQAGFSTTTPSLDAIAESWNRPGDLRTLLTMLRHLREVAIRREGKDLIALRVDGSAKRLSLVAKRGTTGIDRASGHIGRRLHGMIRRFPDGRRMQYVGREALVPSHHLRKLKDSEYWPHFHTAFSPAPQPEKGEPHGAISLWCDPRSQASELSISWAVFLPVSDERDTKIPIEGPTVGRVRLLLHGYFFLDSGRQRIYGIDGSWVRAKPIDEAQTRHAWNAELCNSVVLPLLPRVLHDALENGVLRPNALRSLLMGLAGHDWFRQRRSAICRKDALVCALTPAGSRARKPKWQLCSPRGKLRPLPDFVARNPRLLAELFPGAHAFAASHELVLCTHVDASLFASEMSWSADELNELFSSLQAHVFNRRLLVGRLAEFLRLIESSNAALLASVTGQVVGVLRRALVGSARLVEAEQIASILGLLPDGGVRVVRGARPNRRILRVLAKSESAVLIVPEAYMPNGSRRVNKEDLTALLRALGPEVRGADSEAASRTALALIQGHGGFSAIAADPIVASCAVLRGRRHNVRADGKARGETVILSIKAIRDHVERGLLFAGSPDAYKTLPILADAVREVSPVILDRRIAKFLDSLGIAELEPGKVDKKSLCRTVRDASNYGPAVARRKLIERLRDMPGSDDRQVLQALRCLCAGAREAADAGTGLYYLKDELEGLERIIRALLENDPAAFLVPSEIIDALPPKEAERLKINAIGGEYFDRVAQDPDLRAALASCRPTEDQRAILLWSLGSDETLRRLPIFARTNKTFGSASEMFRETGKWPVPRSLRDRVLLLEPNRKPEAMRREAAMVPEWTPARQVEVALETSDSHRYQREILDALAEAGDVNALGGILVGLLRNSRWLVARSQPVAPVSVLDLPDEVAHEARSLERGGSIPSFVSRQDLPIDVRDHPGFSILEPKVLPCRSKSVEQLAGLLGECSLVGRLGSATDYPLDDFRALAGRRADLALPGWPLLSAVLRSVKRDIEVRRIVDNLAGATEHHRRFAIDHLNALAHASSAIPEPALAACRHAFRAMARWSERSRKAVFSEARVPTQTPDWRIGREVISMGQGLSGDYVLDATCAQILGSDERPNRPVGDKPAEHLALPSKLGGWVIRRGYGHLHDLDNKALEQQAAFLERWFGRIPIRLVVVYLALLGTRELLGSLVQDRATTHDIETWWEETRSKLRLNDEHRLLVDIYRGNTVRAVSLSGEGVEVPLVAGSDELLRGNGHKTGTLYVTDTGVSRHVSKLRVRDEDIRDLRGGNSDAPGRFRRFVETVAVDCVERRTEPDRQALATLLDRAIEVNQTTLRDTKALMQDELHSTLSGLKPEIDGVIWKALSDFRDRRDRATALGKSDSHIARLKADLWKAMEVPEAQVELLGVIRSKIDEYGYSTDRVVFELFQNADDAYHQLHGHSDVSCFLLRVRPGERGGFQTIHWGRAINDFGNDPDEGRRRGFGRDLHNMLLMSFSEKRRRDGLTGQFGLGFKTVHMLSDSVGIASRFLALRTQGGLIPKPWPQGENASDKEQRGGQQATIIDAPFVEDRRKMGREALKAFRESMIWLLLFTKQIRSIEFEDGKLTTVVERNDDEKITDRARVVTVVGDSTERLLMFDVRDGYSLVLRLDHDGPSRLSSALPRLWNLAPLQESLSAGCLLNGPFRLDPGRGRLAGAIDDQRAIMEKRGDAYGDCLRSLYDAATADWDAFCKALDLRGGHASQRDFWSRLFDIVTADLGDRLARHLHGVDRGYGYLASTHAVVPTRLPDPCRGLVTAANVKHRTAGALADEEVQREVLRWPVVASLTGSLVASPVADQLRKLGFDPVEDLSVAKVLQRQLSRDAALTQKASRPENVDPMDGRVDVGLATKLGRLINMKSIERPPLDQERRAILAVASQARFHCQDGEWRSVRQVSARLGADEDLLCDFAPSSALLSVAYRRDGLEFFKVARRESGYGPHAKDLHRWARETNDQQKQRAVLRYLIDGRHGRALAKELQGDAPLWLPGRSELIAHDLLDGWHDAEKQDLARRLYPQHTTVVFKRPVGEHGSGTEAAGNVLLAIHDWWKVSRQEQRRRYEQHVYPKSFDVFPFRNPRISWFTLFAIARFQNLGRATDAHHRTFVDQAYDEGWWKELALNKGNEVAVDLLDTWSDPKQPDHPYRRWRNTLVDLYSIARGLDVYAAVIRDLPRIIREEGRVSLRQLLYPTQSHVHMRLGTVAAPIDSPIGFGINWMIRELVRHGFYSQDDPEVLAPFCWSARARVRRLLDHLGCNLGNDADMDATTRVWDFVRENLGEEQADFGGDFDLPLYMLTLNMNAKHLNYLCPDLARE